MFQQLIGRIREDDNPRLHRVPFMLFWVIAYSIPWYVFLTYEKRLYYVFCEFGTWLKGGLSHTAIWREELFIGLVFGLILSTIQSILIKFRYGFVPKFWYVGTLIGALVAGFGYVRLGSSVGGIRLSPFIHNLPIWFVTMNLLQAIVMFRVNRRSWLLAMPSIVATLMALGILNIPYGLSLRYFAIVAATLTQAIGTGIVMMYLMGNPNKDAVPKRQENSKVKYPSRDGLPPINFIILWLAIFYAATTVVFLVLRMHSIVLWLRGSSRWASLIYENQSLLLILMGIILGIGQQWLINRYRSQHMRYWWLFTLVGWVLVTGIWQIYNRQNTYLGQGTAYYALLFSIFSVPILVQAIYLNRQMRMGWIWTIAGVLSASVVVLIHTHVNMIGYHSFFFGGFISSMITGIAFLYLVAQDEQRKYVDVK